MITQQEIINSEVRALTWKEPFASAMLKGKYNETRPKKTNVRGLVLICAGLTVYTTEDLMRICGERQFSRLHSLGLTYRTFKQTAGKAIGIVRLVDSFRFMNFADESGAFVQLNSGLWIHKYEDATPIEPFPWKGSQGWTILTDDQKKLIKLCY